MKTDIIGGKPTTLYGDTIQLLLAHHSDEPAEGYPPELDDWNFPQVLELAVSQHLSCQRSQRRQLREWRRDPVLAT